jgi:PAS domain S-box-containing protein
LPPSNLPGAVHPADGDLPAANEVLERRAQDLLASEERLRMMFNHAAVGIAVVDLSYRFVDANQQMLSMLGYTLEELRQLTVIDITHPAYLRTTQEQVRRMVAGEISSYVHEKLYIRKDGTSVWSRTRVTLWRDAAGEPHRMIGTIEDITDRKLADDALREERRILELLNATGAAIAAQLDLQTLVQTVTDAGTQISGAKFGAFFYNIVNSAGEGFLLYSLSGAPREAFEKFGLPRNTPVFHPTFGGEGVVRSADITKDPRYGLIPPHYGMPKGHLQVRSYLAVPVISRSGEVIGGLFFGHPDVGVFTPRTEQVIVAVATQAATAIDNARLYDAAQREIANRERAEAALREADRRKDEFLATLAHELRNPLAPIRQAALISQVTTASEAQKRWSHDVISRQVQHMSLLLDDLLDVSRITRGTLELRRQPTELAAIVDAAVETARPAIDAKRHALAVEIPRSPVRFAADPLRLAQVLSNLLTNAAKYTDPEGSIRLSAAAVNGALSITVSDSGIGIPPEDIAGVFAMFSQVKSTRDRSEGGLGIGLALAKGLVELHGGTLEARSRGVGFGSEFIVRIPLTSPDAPQPGAALIRGALARSMRRVLIADDNRDAAESLAMLLRMDGHEVTVAYDGPQALALLAQAQPEVALLDIGMPGLNGYEVAQRIRQSPLGRHVKLIAVTGWGQDRDKAQAHQAGFDHHFTKPVDPTRLSELLRAGHLGG